MKKITAIICMLILLSISIAGPDQSGNHKKPQTSGTVEDKPTYMLGKWYGHVDIASDFKKMLLGTYRKGGALYDDLIDDVVIVSDSVGMGTGMLIGDDILTCNHVVAEDSFVTITFSDGTSVRGTVSKRNVKKDLALISIPSHPKAKSLRLHKGYPEVASKIFQIGHPAGLIFSESEGKISYPIRYVDNIKMIQIDMTTYAGNSGSPVFNEKGEVVGMTERYLKGTSIAFAISSEEINDFLYPPAPKKAEFTD